MTDPFDALRAPILPTDPDPLFADRLRARIERALSLPKGVRMTTIDEIDELATQITTPTTATITPYLAVADARQALRFYTEAFGATPVGEPIVMGDGRIGHAEISLAGGRVFVSDDHPEIGVVAPEPGTGASVSLHVDVVDVDAVTATAVAAGASLEREPGDNPYGRIAVVRDPFGHRWMLNTPPPGTTRVRPGDVVYASLLVPDVERAAAFFGTVLGWSIVAGSTPQSRQIQAATPRHGLCGGQAQPTLLLYHAVADLPAAVARVRAIGGSATDPEQRPYGLLADCTDDQGIAFSLVELPAHQRAPRAPVNGNAHGDISYLSISTPDSASFRAFFGELFGWSFSAGHVSDGWQISDVTPMIGMRGGERRALITPMYRVDDITAAVNQVRQGGGTATEPAREPYGLMAECVDDQGTQFYLGQH